MFTRFFSHLRQNRASLFFLFIALLTLLTCTLRTLALFFGFDAGIAYFQSGSVLVIASNVGLLCCVLLCITVSFLINKEDIPVESESLPSLRFIGAAAVSVALCVAAFFLLFRADTVPAPLLLVLLTALCLLVSAVYFLSRLLNTKPRNAAILGFFTIFAAALALTTTYLDRYTQMNAPHKLSIHICMLAIMFTALYEQRDLLSRSAPRTGVFFTTLSASLCTLFSLSNIIAFCGGVYHDTLYFLFDLVTLGFALYYLAKVLHFALPKKAPPAEVKQ